MLPGEKWPVFRNARERARTCGWIGLHESETIQYFCYYCFALANSLKCLSCLGLINQYEMYYCFVLKFFMILELHRHAAKNERPLFKKLKVHIEEEGTQT